MPSDELDILLDFSECNKHLLERLIRKNKKMKCSRLIHPELRRFALTLQYYSPSAYKYVRKKLDYCLPHARTLSKWYQSVHCEPGINSESMSLIQKQIKRSSYALIGALMFDEMSIRHDQHDVASETYGAVDLGRGVQGKNAVATEVLVFLVVCVNANWKVPIAYYFTHCLSAEAKANLINQCLIALHNINFQIVSVTCDGTHTNFSALEKLGCYFKLPNFKTYFFHPLSRKQPVFVYLDASHMLKLIRNNFAKIKNIIDDERRYISWSYLKKLNKLQTEETFTACNKVSLKHIDFAKQKMKVKLAAQLLSKSVSDALLFCKDDLKDPDFEKCDATAKFIKTFNDLFDIFNSHSIREYGYRKPINSENYEDINKVLNDTATYMKKLLEYVKDNRLRQVITGDKKAGFIGFLANIRSLQRSYKYLCVEKKLLSYIPTYKFSQDHLEMYFSVIRSRGGCNNNPDAVQFRSAFKKTLTHVELSVLNTGNCTPIDDIEILHVSSRRPALKVLDTPTSCWTKIIPIQEDHDYTENIITPLTPFSMNVIVYMAGFTVRKIQKKLGCIDCLKALITQPRKEEEAYHALIRRKSRGFLMYPSADVVNICRICEKALRTTFTNNNNILKPGMHSKLQNEIIAEFVGTNILHDLHGHTTNQHPLQRHRYFIIKVIVQTYLKARICHLLRLQNMKPSERQFYNKLIIFKGF